MPKIPANDLRQNVATLAIPNEYLPSVARCMTKLLATEEFDPEFLGQQIETTYFDSTSQDLRKARLKKNRYCTLRIRCYRPSQAYALSLKTEEGKWRRELDPELAELYLNNGFNPLQARDLLPGDLMARLVDLTDGGPLVPVVCVRFTRYSVENDTNRLTLDCGIATDTGKVFPTNVLEAKTTQRPWETLPEIEGLPFRPIKLSKFLWATTYGVR